MDDQLKAIEHEMKETRAALLDRAEALERHVFGMVHETTSAVSESVQSAKDVVDDAVGEIRDSAHVLVNGLKEVLDLRLQVERHPYAMLCAAIALGYVTPRVVHRLNRAPRDGYLEEHPRNSNRQELGWPKTEDAPGTTGAIMFRPKSSITQVREKFEYEIRRLKELAIGAALGAVRDYLASSAPEQIGEEMSEIIDSFTKKVGGKPIAGPVFSPER